MGMQKRQSDEGDNDYLSSFESSDRRRKVMLAAAAIVIALLVIGGFLVTIGSLGQMGRNVSAVFGESQKGPNSATTPTK